MLIGIITDNNIQIGHYKELFNNISFPTSGPSDDFLASHNAKRVNLFKNHDRATQKLVTCQPYVEGDWVYTVEVQDKTQEEINSENTSLAAQKRAERNRLLAASDWTQIPDSALATEKKTEWATYRQTLRDLPNDPAWPNVTMPNDPDWVDPLI